MSVINAYWYGGIDKLPPTARYVGRPSVFGNPFRTDNDTTTREIAVGRYWVYLYRRLRDEPGLVEKMMALKPYDLACTCKSHKKEVACHGDPLQFYIDQLTELGWQPGDRFCGTLGIRNEYQKYIGLIRQQLGKLRVIPWPYEIAIEELFMEIEEGLRARREMDDKWEAAQYFAICTVYLRTIYNEGRGFDYTYIDYVCDCLVYLSGARSTLPTLTDLKPRKKKKDP